MLDTSDIGGRGWAPTPPLLESDADTDFFQSLQLIKEKKIFEKNNLIIIHREKKTDEDFKSFLKIIETKYYGRSKIIFGIIN